MEFTAWQYMGNCREQKSQKSVMQIMKVDNVICAVDFHDLFM